jgi:hypothetical protein
MSYKPKRTSYCSNTCLSSSYVESQTDELVRSNEDQKRKVVAAEKKVQVVLAQYSVTGTLGAYTEAKEVRRR